MADRTLDKEYLPIDGDQLFLTGARGSLFGWDHPDVSSGRVASIQTLSGSGALRTTGDLLNKFRPAPIYISDPTWENHLQVFNAAGLKVRRYRYINKDTSLLDLPALLADLRNATAGSNILF